MYRSGVAVCQPVDLCNKSNIHTLISQAGMPYTKQYNLCSVPYSLAQPLFGFNCPGSIAVNGSGEWGAL